MNHQNACTFNNHQLAAAKQAHAVTAAGTTVVGWVVAAVTEKNA